MPQWAASVWSLFVVDKPIVPTVAGWFGVTISSLSLLGWVPTLVGLVLLAMVWVQTRERPAAPPPPWVPITAPPRSTRRITPIAAPIVLSAPDDERIFIEQTPIDLTAPFEAMTAYRATKIVEDYYGKWVRWTYPISNIIQYDKSVSVFLSAPGKRATRETVVASFPLSESAKVIHLEKGALLSLEGQIESADSMCVRLDHCRLLPTKRSQSDEEKR
jgi:hypothetical protein